MRSITVTLKGCPPGWALTSLAYNGELFDCSCDKDNEHILSCEPNGNGVVLKVCLKLMSHIVDHTVDSECLPVCRGNIISTLKLCYGRHHEYKLLYLIYINSLFIMHSCAYLKNYSYP